MPFGHAAPTMRRHATHFNHGACETLVGADFDFAREVFEIDRERTMRVQFERLIELEGVAACNESLRNTRRRSHVSLRRLVGAARGNDEQGGRERCKCGERGLLHRKVHGGKVHRG